MTFTVQKGTPADARHLLEASHALMESLFPSESNHYLSLDELEADNIRFITAVEDGAVIGCGALAIKSDYCEVKSMFTDPGARGKGVADAILAHLSEVGREAGAKRLLLETGNTLHAAHRLYERHGFTKRGPFGDYPDDPISLFYEKPL